MYSFDISKKSALISVTLEVSARVDWNAVRQRIAGFGFSEAFNKAGSIYRQAEPLRSQLLDFLFDRKTGIGASILRNIVGDGGYNTSGWGSDYDGSADTIWPDKAGGFVWERPGWASVKDRFDFYQIWLTREAVKRGLNTVIATCWSPPGWMKSNGTVMGDPGACLPPERYQDFAEYLAEYVLGYQREFGITVAYLSPANEPDASVAYPGCMWTPEAMTRFIKNHLGPVFAAKKVPAKIILPECVEWQENSMIKSLLLDEEAEPSISAIASHAYHLAGPDVDPMPLVKAKNKALWMTEIGELSNTGFRFNTIVNGLANGRIIQEMMTKAHISGWLYWWGAANNGADGSDLIRLGNRGTDQTLGPSENGTYRVFKRFYALGNFSRFIRPGYARIEAEQTLLEGFTLTAYKDPRGGAFAIVAVNETNRRITLNLALTGFPELTELSPYVTSAIDNLRLRNGFPVSGGMARAALPPQSIVTLTAPEAVPLDLALKHRDVFSLHPAAEADELYNGAFIEDGARLTADGYALFAAFNFADGSASGQADESRKLTMIVEAFPERSGVLEARLDSPDGYLAGYAELPAAQGPQEYPIPLSTCTLDELMAGGSPAKAYGIRQLYLVLRGNNAALNIMSIRFDADWEADRHG